MKTKRDCVLTPSMHVPHRLVLICISVMAALDKRQVSVSLIASIYSFLKLLYFFMFTNGHTYEHLDDWRGFEATCI